MSDRPALSRVGPLVALVAFGAAHWMMMLEPAATVRAAYAVGLALLVACALLVARRLPGAARKVALAGTVAGGAALALLAGGVGAEWLAPGRWGALAATIGDGLGSLPGARIPYAGLDDELRLVLELGGMLLTLSGALLACWPRRAPGRLGFTVPALAALVTLYAVPAVALVLRAEFLRGALLALLVVAFLCAGRLRAPQLPAAAGLAGAAVVLALVLAPALDGADPWWDYEDWAETAAGARTTAFAWDHNYGLLRWPRDGRELLRVQSRQRAYWKVDELDQFDGIEWIRDVGFTGGAAPGLELAGIPPERLRRWSFPLRVTVRNLWSGTLPLAGSAIDVRMPGRAGIQVGGGIWTVGRPIRRGDVYAAQVYVPQPSAADLEAAGTAYDYGMEPYTSVTVVPAWGPHEGVPVRIFSDGFFGVRPTLQDAHGVPATDVLRRSNLWRAYRLSRRLLAAAVTPYDYVELVRGHLAQGYRYDEAPPRASRTLDGFLFDSHAGFCQHFSGAMALLLRLGGVPARVATGFAPGAYDRRHREYVVRDLDAHSWVEAWFPGIGWVTFDPTPAAAPARSQASFAAPSAARGDVRDIGVTRTGRAVGPLGGSGAGLPWGLIALGALGAALPAVVGRRLWARRGRPRPGALGELERALRAVGEPLTPPTTLRGLEHRFEGSPAASYLAALRDQRYGRGGDPTAAQRRALRRVLGRGRGPLVRARTWLALRPRRLH